MHVVSNSYGMYLPEAYQRWHSYPGPNNGSYSHPWLWYDGNPHGGSSYSTWPTKILTRMAIPSQVAIRMWGDYNVVTRTGTIFARFRNDSTSAINANVLFVVTEDSIQLATPNGDLWHNHVARDYVPGPVGTPISIPTGDSIIYSQTYAIDAAWNVNQCEIVAIIQDTVLRPDSTKEILQGRVIKVIALGIEEENKITSATYKVNVTPNPCLNETWFTFSLPNGEAYKINIFDITGRTVETIKGIASGAKEIVGCDLRDAVNSGIYFYRFESNVASTSGKIIVK